MKIAELFVKLGVSGGNDAKRELSGVTDSMKNIGSASLQAKAMLLGVVYGLQRMMSHSAHTGKELNHFSELTGISARKLQQWQYAARQASVGAEEVTSSFKTIQDAMTEMIINDTRPESWNLFQSMVNPDLSKIRDTEYMLLKLQEFAQRVAPDVGRKFLSQFGLSEGMIVAMRRNAFNEDVFKNAPAYSEKQTKSLERIHKKWANMMADGELMFGKLTAKHGDRLVADISGVANSIFKLIDSLAQLADKMKVFKLFSKSLEGWSMLIDLINEGTQRIKDDDGKPKDINPYEPGTKMHKFYGQALKEQMGFQMERMMERGQIRNPIQNVESKPVINIKVGDSAKAEEVMKAAEKGVVTGTSQVFNQIRNNQTK